MLFPLLAAGLAAAVATVPTSTRVASRAPASPDLAIRASLDGRPRDGRVASLRTPALAAAELDGMPPCVGDVCQPRVSVPGYDPSYFTVSRTDLTLAYLDRVRLEPFATIAWVLLLTGLRVDYSPPVADAATPQGWGTVHVRVRFRVDADNHPVVPRRARDAPPRHDDS